jgi:hypothetical protein
MVPFPWLKRTQFPMAIISPMAIKIFISKANVPKLLLLKNIHQFNRDECLTENKLSSNIHLHTAYILKQALYSIPKGPSKRSNSYVPVAHILVCLSPVKPSNIHYHSLYDIATSFNNGCQLDRPTL